MYHAPPAHPSAAPPGVTCLRCGQSWPRDPVLEVACPSCHAKVGSGCKRPSGHQAQHVHAARDLLALATVLGYGPCPAAEPIAAPQRRATPTNGTTQLTLNL